MPVNRGIAILGGTFDPVHIGHLSLAEAVRGALSLNQVRLIPSFSPPHRSPPEASAADRLAMLRLAAEGREGIVVDDREMIRRGRSFTVDTLRSIRQEVAPDLPIYFIVGMDAYRTIDQWYEWQTIIELAHIVVLERPGHDVSLPSQVLKWTRQRLRQPGDPGIGPGGAVLLLDLGKIDVSATEIRACFHRGGQPAKSLPAPVMQYIQCHGLYQSTGKKES
ncbi:MAG: nicotinate-nucleotide adenylyltransferase [Proteobacteria bacterium]|jgi:nicotinate-nucleotide adenylyltransferase|nr:nicotinate-nucleotide adenylyltransferase [Pseudomonadota bacterium]MDA1298491.1 nicotinate-nucleotide adenylyltransferase [Pseudomonadota bacterium]